MPEETQVQEQAAPQAEQRLDMSEILGALQVAQNEVAKYTNIANTLSKCAILFDTVVKAQSAQQQADQEVEQPQPDQEPAE